MSVLALIVPAINTTIAAIVLGKIAVEESNLDCAVGSGLLTVASLILWIAASTVAYNLNMF